MGYNFCCWNSPLQSYKTVLFVWGDSIAGKIVFILAYLCGCTTLPAGFNLCRQRVHSIGRGTGGSSRFDILNGDWFYLWITILENIRYSKWSTRWLIFDVYDFQILIQEKLLFHMSPDSNIKNENCCDNMINIKQLKCLHNQHINSWSVLVINFESVVWSGNQIFCVLILFEGNGVLWWNMYRANHSVQI